MTRSSGHLVRAAGVVLTTLLAAPAARAAGQEVVLACYAGDIQDYFIADILPAFEKQYDAKVTYLPGVSTATISKIQAEKASPQIDVACLDDGPQYQAKAMGLLQPTDPARLPNLADIYKVARMADNVGVGWALFGVGIAYNPDALKQAGITPPNSWNDLADPKLKDHVVVDSITTTYGLDLLIMLARANGGGVKDIDPGFAKMKAVAANVVNFDTTADLSKYFQQGEAWVGVWTNSETNAFAARTKFPLEFVYPREGAPALMATASVVKGAPHPKLAEELVNYLIGGTAQTIIGKKIGFGPVNAKVELSPEEAAKVTYGPEAAGRLVQMDWATINADRPAWTEQWNREIER